MWIKSAQYIKLIEDNATNKKELELREGQIARLQQEIDYWRDKFESAQNRADRIADKSLAVSGIGPVSDLGMKELDEAMGKYAKMAKEAEKQTTEMFGEEIRDDGKENSELEIDPQLLTALVDGLRE